MFACCELKIMLVTRGQTVPAPALPQAVKTLTVTRRESKKAEIRDEMPLIILQMLTLLFSFYRLSANCSEFAKILIWYFLG